MEYFHGTIDKFVPAILREGLAPHKNDNGWDIEIERFLSRKPYIPKEDDEDGWVYFSDDESYALTYAIGRANYYKTQPGHSFTIPNLIRDARKRYGAPVIPDAKPAIIRLSLPDSIRVEQDDESRGLRFRGTIPASYVGVVDTTKLSLEQPAPESRINTYTGIPALLEFLGLLQNSR
jgi:hypothetical protein